MPLIKLRSGEAQYPLDHKPGMRVPKGGSDCAKCEYLSSDSAHCRNPDWIAWHRGDDKLPYPADEYCCDWYERP